MCHNTVVKTVVDGFVQKGFMFTAFDVTKFLRKSGQSVRHSDVNDAVKQIYRDGEMTDYQRDTVDVGAPVPPFVYYHQNADVSNYSQDWLENNPTQTGMKNDGNVTGVTGVAQPTPSSFGSATPIGVVMNHGSKTYVAPVVAPVVAVPKGVKVTDMEGRLYIGPIMTGSAGLIPKQTVWVYPIGADKLVIKDYAAGSGLPVTVNSDGRIRVCRTILKQIKSATVGYKVSAGNGEIEIVPA